MSFRIISRAEAELHPPKRFPGWMKLPASDIWVHHSVTQEYVEEEARGMREIQQIAFNRKFLDISYSWLFFVTGVIGEGRGWGVVGAHTTGYNSISHGFCFVGNYENRKPTQVQLDAARWLIGEGIRLGKISPPREDRPDGGHRDTKATACPGKNVYSRIPHLREAFIDPSARRDKVIYTVEVTDPPPGVEVGLWVHDEIHRRHIKSMDEWFAIVGRAQRNGNWGGHEKITYKEFESIVPA